MIGGYTSPRFFRHRKSRIHTDFSLNSARKDAISSVSIFTKDYRYILSDNCIKTVENRTRDYKKCDFVLRPVVLVHQLFSLILLFHSTKYNDSSQNKHYL